MVRQPTDSSAPADGLPSAHPYLIKARQLLNPSAAAKLRVQQSIRRRIGEPSVLKSARTMLTPSNARGVRTWLRIRGLLGPSPLPTLWDKLRDQLHPSASLSARLWQRISPQLAMVPVPATRASSYRTLKLVSAFAVLLLAVRISPVLFLITPTIAESHVVLHVTRGTAAVLSEGLWQPVIGEVPLQQEATVRTEDGELTIRLHDDAVIRLAPFTTVVLHDLKNRPSSENSGIMTLSLQQGKIWVLGLLPRPIEALHIGTDQAQVDVQEGSVSIRDVGDTVVVDTWDRSAVVSRRSKPTNIVAGEQLTIVDGTLSLSHIDPVRYDDAWVAGNLNRDAVHQREIAQMQQERRAAAAGILPDSTLYPAKRLAEAVDVLFTFGSEAKAKKLITQANTRLNEAAALISRGSGSDATAVLQEYKQTLLSVASGSGGNANVDSLLKEEVVEKAIAQTAAALPNDGAYALKEAVRQTIAELPETVEKPSDLRVAVLLDQLSTLRQQVSEGSATSVQISAVESLLREQNTSDGFAPEELREVRANLSTLSAVLSEQTDEDDTELTDESTTSDRPPRRERGAPSERPPLTDVEVEVKVQEILGRIFIFEGRESRRNTFFDEMRGIETNPDRGRILRQLETKDLPAGFKNLLEYEKQRLNDETKAQLENTSGEQEAE